MRYLATLLLFASLPTLAAPLLVTDQQGAPIAQAMVTRTPLDVPTADLRDDGYAPDGVTNTAATTITRFTDAAGKVEIAAQETTTTGFVPRASGTTTPAKQKVSYNCSR